MWTDRQFWLDATWRSFRTFCQSLAGLLLAVQTSDQITAMPTISIPWYGYIYSSGVAALISLLQSIDRERAVENTDPVVEIIPEPAAAEVTPSASAVFASGCGDDLR